MADQKNPVGWFEIPVTDLERAKAFYEHVFEVELSLNELGPLKMAWFLMFEDAIGSAGTLVKADGYVPSLSGTLIYFTAPDIEATLERVNEKGGKTLTPKTGIGEHGYIAHFEDSEGNRIALHSRN